MMKTLIWNNLTADGRRSALARPTARADETLVSAVKAILDDVERRGADAVNHWSQLLDGVPAARIDLDPGVVASARAKLSREDIEAIEIAAENIMRYHEETKPADSVVDFECGLQCRRVFRPIPSCGLYVPGGTAPLFSTLMMLALPAKAAGVNDRIVVTPPSRRGETDPVMITAGALSQLDAIWLVGGAQAIGALAFGALLPKAVKIFGPGNAYVAEAKRQIAARGVAAIDLPAGPSELMVIADQGADASTVAADLLGQAEHDANAQVILATPSGEFAARVCGAIAEQLRELPRRDVAEAALDQSKLIIVRDLHEAAEIANLYAPEHLALHAADGEGLAARIENAGAVFIGAASAEAFGDYLCGPSHVLPTDGAARVFSGVTTGSFMKSMSLQRLTPSGARSLATTAARLARLEGLEAHARSAERRL